MLLWHYEHGVVEFCLSFTEEAGGVTDAGAVQLRSGAGGRLSRQDL